MRAITRNNAISGFKKSVKVDVQRERDGAIGAKQKHHPMDCGESDSMTRKQMNSRILTPEDRMMFSIVLLMFATAVPAWKNMHLNFAPSH
ncbi:hypothetical protein KIN20_024662 [Parelaphostrongylus tenuis]|uniref:Uncharacterized protein n=1 Tax=Parelaphostrongylus tenuis TaxID=148309 RepID=A0AAD5MX97_PARTN|nr:hypothetical protein KIN20_024662 [Parelaphostrongylus tenuis]